MLVPVPPRGIRYVPWLATAKADIRGRFHQSHQQRPSKRNGMEEREAGAILLTVRCCRIIGKGKFTSPSPLLLVQSTIDDAFAVEKGKLLEFVYGIGKKVGTDGVPPEQFEDYPQQPWDLESYKDLACRLRAITPQQTPPMNPTERVPFQQAF